MDVLELKIAKQLFGDNIDKAIEKCEPYGILLALKFMGREDFDLKHLAKSLSKEELAFVMYRAGTLVGIGDTMRQANATTTWLKVMLALKEALSDEEFAELVGEMTKSVLEKAKRLEGYHDKASR